MNRTSLLFDRASKTLKLRLRWSIRKIKMSKKRISMAKETFERALIAFIKKKEAIKNI
jgi:hypothetical protein